MSAFVYQYLNDSGGNTWRIAVDYQGALSQASVPANTPSPSTVNDYPGNSTSWIISIDTNGRLNTTSTTFSSTNPFWMLLGDQNGNVWGLGVDSNGRLVVQILFGAYGAGAICVANDFDMTVDYS